MGLTAADLRVGIERISARINEIERELNAADAKLGDGDTGVMLRRVVEQLVATSSVAPDNVAGAFRAYAMTSSAATGSSLGTLITIALTTASRIAQSEQEVEWNGLGHLLDAVVEAMSKRGGAELGDKTILDGVSAAAHAVDGLSDPRDIRAAILEAAGRALFEYRDRPCRAGRARMFAERSVGLDDPGMLAFFHVMNAALGDSSEHRVPMSTAPAWASS